MTRFAITPGLVLAILGLSVLADAQPAEKMWRIGYLTFVGPPRQEFREALREHGYVEGRTIALETRSAEGNADQFPALAADLVRSKVDVIVAVAPPAIRAAGQATTTIPIVMAYWGRGTCSSPASSRPLPGPAATSRVCTCLPRN